LVVATTGEGSPTRGGVRLESTQAVAAVHTAQLGAVEATAALTATGEVRNVFEFATAKCTVVAGRGPEVVSGGMVKVHVRAEVVSTGRAAFWNTNDKEPLGFVG
jgi:hypothetical protein